MLHLPEGSTKERNTPEHLGHLSMSTSMSGLPRWC